MKRGNHVVRLPGRPKAPDQGGEVDPQGGGGREDPGLVGLNESRPALVGAKDRADGGGVFTLFLKHPDGEVRRIPVEESVPGLPAVPVRGSRVLVGPSRIEGGRPGVLVLDRVVLPSPGEREASLDVEVRGIVPVVMEGVDDLLVGGIECPGSAVELKRGLLLLVLVAVFSHEWKVTDRGEGHPVEVRPPQGVAGRLKDVLQCRLPARPLEGRDAHLAVEQHGPVPVEGLETGVRGLEIHGEADLLHRRRDDGTERDKAPAVAREVEREVLKVSDVVPCGDGDAAPVFDVLGPGVRRNVAAPPGHPCVVPP